MVSWWRKCVLILKKHLQIRVYHYFLTIIEIALPITVALMLAWLKRFENEYLELVNPILFGKDVVPEDEYFLPEDPLLKMLEAEGYNFSVIFTPDNLYTRALVNYSSQRLNFLPDNVTVEFFGVQNKDAITNHQWPGAVTPNMFLIFDQSISLEALPTTLPYQLTIRAEYHEFIDNVALTLQHLVALHFMKEVKGHDVSSEITFAMQKFPMPAPSKKGTFINYLSVFYFGYLMPLCFIFTVPVFVTQTVMEKQTGVKELLRLTGLPVAIQWFGFFVNSFATMFISAVGIVVVLTHQVFQDANPLIEQTGSGHLLLLFTLYVLSCISFCFFLSSLSSDATRATLYGLLIWCLTFLIPFLVSDAGDTGLMNTSEQMLFALMPNMALFWGIRLIVILERQDGLKLKHYYSSPTLAEDLVILHVLFMLLVDIVLYLLLGWYLDQLFPGPFGVPQPWYFLVTKSYWSSSSCMRANPAHEVLSSDSDFEEEPSIFQRAYQASIQPILQKLHLSSSPTASTSSTSQAGNFESDPTNLPKVVVASNLTKVFKNVFTSPFVAVNKVSFNAYKGEILVLLGHNGAGKTVTMSMITGSYYPTSGDVYIHGYSMQTQRHRAREAMSFCPQTAMYFPELTVQQHFMLFGRLKGLRGELLEEEVETLLEKLNLWEKRNRRGNALSGGMLRRLQLGMAAIGHVKFIVLDEPTSGLDPEARRLVWDLLLEMRSSCCILLTTHNMEEADALGDRIAIMSQGRIICCGSPMFLRNRYGSTYIMNITKAAGCKINPVLDTIRKHVPDATVDRNTHTELSVALPVASTRAYPKLFRDIENNMERLNITSFGLSTAGLEEIFLKVNEAAEKKRSPKYSQKGEYGGGYAMEASESSEIYMEMAKGRVLCWQRFYALIMKRVYYVYHRAFFFFSQFMIVAVTAFLVLMMVNKEFQKQSTTPLLESVLDKAKHHMIFESHSTTRYCLPDAYLENIPEHVKVSTINNQDVLGDILKFAKMDRLGYIKGHYVLGATFMGGETGNVTANALYFSDEAERLPFYKIVSLSLVHNAVLQNCANTRRTIIADVQISRVSESGEWAVFMPDYVIAMKYLQNSLAAVLLTIGLGLLCCCFVFLPTHERLVQAKHLQLMTGTGRFLFWFTAFLFDYFFYMVCALFCIFILVIFASDSVMSEPHVPELMFMGMLLFGLSAIPFSYLFSCYAKSVTGAYVSVLVIHMLCAIVLGVGHEALFVYYRKDGNPVPDFLTYGSIIPELLPGCCVAVIFIRIWMNSLLGQLKICWNFCSAYMATDAGGSGRQMIILALSALGYVIVMFFLENRSPNRGRRLREYFKRTPSETASPKDDADVEAECERVKYLRQRQKQRDSTAESSASSQSSFYMEDDVLLVDGLTKRYTGDTMSVDHLTFGVKQDECFGLLGVNGAGKTTTFRMLSGVLTITSGNAYLRGISIIDKPKEFLSQVGYCPQFDAIIDHLSARDTLLLYARLRGVKEKHIKKLVDTYLNQFGLKDYAHKTTINYSLGTKRRLSAAVAFLGSPALVMMDEPTTGVDPASRRKIWNATLSSVARGTSLILTSHSMDECEVLCSRLAIMKKGQLKCIGAVQHLKAKFGKGFKVHVKLPKLQDPQKAEELRNKVEKFMKDTFKNCVKRDDHEGLLEYSVPYESTNWQKLFKVMESAMDQYNLDDYSVCQATLEQVFLMFAFDEPEK